MFVIYFVNWTHYKNIWQPNRGIRKKTKRFHNDQLTETVGPDQLTETVGPDQLTEMLALINTLKQLALINSLKQLALINSLKQLALINSLKQLALINSLKQLAQINSVKQLALINSLKQLGLINTKKEKNWEKKEKREPKKWERPVDVVFLLYKSGEAMLDSAIRPFVITAVCQDMSRDVVNDSWTRGQQMFMNGSLDPCDYLTELPLLESPVQARSATFLMIHRILVSVPAAFLGLLCGAWSDRTGRKPPMIIPSLGSILAVLLYILGVLLVKHTLMIIMIGGFVQGALGKSSVITMAVNSYISDTTSDEDRSRMLGQLLAMNFFGLIIGSALAGALQDLTNLQTTLGVVIGFHSASMLTVVIFVKEASDKNSSREKEFKRGNRDMLSFLSLQSVKDSVRALVKPREEGKRTLVIVAFMAMFLNQTCKVGEQDVTVLFVQKAPLSWQPSGYGYLLSVDCAGMGLCLLLLLPVLSSFFKLSDVTIVLLGLGFKLMRNVATGFCTLTWMVYVSVLVSSPVGVISSGSRSILSKAVCDDETGKVFALASSAETLAKLLGSVVFVNIYAATLDIWAGLAYISAALVTLDLIILMVWLCIRYQTKPVVDPLPKNYQSVCSRDTTLHIPSETEKKDPETTMSSSDALH
ncbi:proton-coupled folate transporter-like [Physella acuta]|uniref:proton-coupled folate transporter-like n=1 Tax=Physella acuta TaxID=109671 RepID=UPI0027DCB809|nr:proton-coupled folate transporter-like [Physella acuta]